MATATADVTTTNTTVLFWTACTLGAGDRRVDRVAGEVPGAATLTERWLGRREGDEAAERDFAGRAVCVLEATLRAGALMPRPSPPPATSRHEPSGSAEPPALPAARSSSSRRGAKAPRGRTAWRCGPPASDRR